MIRTIVHALLAGSLIAGVASCKKKEGESSGSSGKSADNAPPSSGIPECESYFKAMDKFAACDKLRPQEKELYKGGNDKMRTEMASAKDKTAAADQCKKAMQELAEGAKSRGCPVE